MTRLPSEGETFGRYLLRRVLGAGGMGMVFAAHDPVLDREVALKLVVPHLAGDPEFRARFQHEAEVLARLDSARIVQIFDHGEHDGTLFLVTQLVDGGDLSTLIRRDGPLSPALAVRVLDQVLEGLGDAHAVGVVHRDIKPANVLLRERGRELEAFLCDFGIATTPGADLSRTGSVAGSLPYMAPERHQGDEAGPQGDVYAAGCLLWHALTGSAPYAGTDVEVAVAHLQAPIPQLPGRDEFSRRMNAVLGKALAKEPRRRYPSAKAMLTELRALAPIAPGAIALPGSTAIRQAVKVGVRRRAWRPAVLAVAGVLVVTGIASAAALTRGDRGTATPDQGPETLFATETLRPREVEAPRTLSPSAERITRADGDVVVAAPAAPRMDEPPAADARGRGGVPRPSAAPDVSEATPTAAPQRPVPASSPASSSAPPPPSPRYQCWDGARVVRYSSCTWPRGGAGARYLFRNVDGCHGNYDVKAAGDVEAWLCPRRHADGSTSYVTVARWKSESAALAHYDRDWMSHSYNPGTWVMKETYFGRKAVGRHGSNGGRYRLVRIYTASGTRPWTYAINASSRERRARLYDSTKGFRWPGSFRGFAL